jgi:hypothetical protein
VNISLRSRRGVMVAAALLALGLGGFAAVSAAPAGAATATAVGTPTITDDVQGTVTSTDDIVTCLPSTIAIGRTEAVAFTVGCLSEYYGDNVTVTWSGSGISTELTLQGIDGNFVLYAGNGKKWGAGTRAVDISTGPGCEAAFQSDANLVVRNCDGATIWASGTHTYPNAVLCFQADGNLVIYSAASGGKALWSTKTNS